MSSSPVRTEHPERPLTHALRHHWTFWYMQRSSQRKEPGTLSNASSVGSLPNYASNIKPIATVSTVEAFWSVYLRLKRPSQWGNGVTGDYHLFREGVTPMWEDEANVSGGKWIVRFKRGIVTRLWEDLLLATIGEQFEVGNEICGIVCSIRYHEDILSVWNRSADKAKINMQIRETLKRVLHLPASTPLEYKEHNESLQDKSSYRNASVRDPAATALSTN